MARIATTMKAITLRKKESLKILEYGVYIRRVPKPHSPNQSFVFLSKIKEMIAKMADKNNFLPRDRLTHQKYMDEKVPVAASTTQMATNVTNAKMGKNISLFIFTSTDRIFSRC